MDSELAAWLDEFAAAAREAGLSYAKNLTEDRPLPDPRMLMYTLVSVYDHAVDIEALLVALRDEPWPRSRPLLVNGPPSPEPAHAPVSTRL